MEVVSVSGEVLATSVRWDAYMSTYAHDYTEWVRGVVVKMPPVHERHDALHRYLLMLLEAYFAHRPIGQVRHAPFVMRLSNAVSREPDVQIVLHSNPHELKPTYMDGPADICIEIVSLESVQRDHGEKFREYEAGGVPEYWIIDPLRHESRFCRLNADGVYEVHREDADGIYRTPALSGLALHVPTLWQSPLPNLVAIMQAVERMLS